MNEQFLQYVWFSKLFSPKQQTTDLEAVEIIDIGMPNTNAGPDVFNAKIKIGETTWAGNVEFHVNAGDWQQHRHNCNKAYDSVILHVVLEAGENAVRSDGTVVPQLVIKFSPKIKETYQAITLPFVPCAEKLLKNKNKNLEKPLELLLNERLNQKSAAIENLLEQTKNDWEEAFYITTARSFGFGVNSPAFEQAARNLPQKILAKHKNNILQIEALLFGSAGLLENLTDIDEYSKNLVEEYTYLKHKYELKNIDRSLWKFLRLRPSNFPTVRLAQFADLVQSSSKLFSKILEQKNYENLLELFSCQPSEYWTNHYVFGKISSNSDKKMSKYSIDIVLINSVIPFLYCYSEKYQNSEIKNFAISLLKKIPAEKNHITNGFEALGIKSASAFDTQALTQLKNNYCNRKDCYKCKNNFNFF
jgi:hypothetical protein